jgi:hypothetical protein
LGRLSPESLVGGFDSDAFPAEDAQRLTEIQRRVLRTRSGSTTILPVRFNGTRHLLELTIEPWFDLDDNVLGVVTYARDVSDEYGTKQALLEQFRRTSAIFGSLDALVYVSDMETHELLFLNTYGQRLFGRDAVGKPCYRVLQSNQTEPCRFCTNHLLVRDGKPAPAHIWEFKNTLTGCWFLCVDQAIPWTDGKLKRMEVAVEITDKKEAEQFRQQYIGIVSHDLKNPLNAVALGCEVLQRRCSDAEDLAIIGRMKRGVERMNSMITDLAESVRLESAGLIVKNEKLDLPALVNDVVDGFGVTPEQRGRIDLSLSKTVPALFGDRARIERVLQNLIGNALKYSPSDTLVSVSVARRGNDAEVAVEDRGCGIDASDLPHVFDRFYRCEGTRNVEGLGLGLYISRLIVEAHGGTIRVVSDRSKGSRFSFTLPGE